MPKDPSRSTERNPPRAPAAAPRTVVICGDSVLLCSVGASLRPQVTVEFMRPEAPVAEKLKRVRNARAEAVVFELGLTSPEWVFEFLRADPELVLVGVEWGSDCALVLSGRATRAWTGEDLLRAIERAGRAPQRGSEGEDPDGREAEKLS